MRRRGLSRVLALLFAFALLAAACGDDDDGGGAEAGGDEPTTTAAAAPDEGAATTAAPDTGGETTEAAGEGSAGCPAADTSIDADFGQGAGQFVADLTCAKDAPLAAEGDPVVIGVHTPEGDPNGSFPEFALAMEAAVDYINTELGGWGADIPNGVPGRPIELSVCATAISPDDSLRCANELAGEDPLLVISSINFFGNHFSVFDAAGITSVVLVPITVADFTSPNTFSIGAGGGCLGVHTGLVEFTTNDLGARRVAVPWADTPPGVVCYYDLENKPLQVLKGTVEGTSEKAGSMPELETIGVPILPATPDVTPQVTEVLDFDPDAIIFSAQGADCWNLVDGLGRLGWTPDAIPLNLSTACLDFDAMRAAGDLAVGVYLTGSVGSNFNELDTIENPTAKFEAEIYQTKAIEYGLAESELFKGFAGSGFNGMITLWQTASDLAKAGQEPTGEAIGTALRATEDQHAFNSTPLQCALAPPPYVAVCNSTVSTSQWDGEKLVPVRQNFSGLDLIAGTEIQPGP